MIIYLFLSKLNNFIEIPDLDLKAPLPGKTLKEYISIEKIEQDDPEFDEFMSKL